MMAFFGRELQWIGPAPGSRAVSGALAQPDCPIADVTKGCRREGFIEANIAGIGNQGQVDAEMKKRLGLPANSFGLNVDGTPVDILPSGASAKRRAKSK
jgi:hypothetical protein